jgi:hypothetical protein
VEPEPGLSRGPAEATTSDTVALDGAAASLA